MKISSWRLRPKLVASYVLLTLCTTLVTLGGSQWIQEANDAREAYRLRVMSRTSDVVLYANGAADKGFAYVVGGDPAARDAALAKIGDARAAFAEVSRDQGMTPEERSLADDVTSALQQQQVAARELFDDYSKTSRIDPTRFAAYEMAINRRVETLSHFRNVFRAAQSAGAHHHYALLILLVGLLALVVAVALGYRLARFIAAPVILLRDATVAFGAGRTTLALPTSSGDEIGELAAAFETMTRDVQLHVAETRRSQQLLEDVYASVREALVVLDGEGRIVNANPACCRMSGYEAESLVGKSSGFLFEEEVIDLEQGDQTRELDTSLKTAGDKRIAVRVSVTSLRGKENVGWVCVAQNLTERHRLEGELRQAQKMDAIGRLAGGVAHDFNNLLQVIVGNSEAMLEDLTARDALREPLVEVIDAGERAAELTRQLLAFSRKQMLDPQVIDLNEIVVGAEKMLRRLLGKETSLQTIPMHEPGRVKVDRGQIEQVILNLVVNGRDAMPNGGVVTVETKAVRVGPGDRLFAGALPGDYVALSVTDTGVGMDAATRARIFEPFFTTKGVGKGTGLGLSTVFGIVQQSGGHISVASTKGEGTCVCILFPWSESSPRLVQAEQARDSIEPHGAETILIVEDEEAIRRLAAKVLRRRGYNVLEAPGAGEALLICEQHTRTIDLVLTDMMMPLMNGRRLFERLHGMRPSLKVVYMSGYPDDSLVHSGDLARGLTFLQKPFTPDRLTQRIREVLDADGTPGAAHGGALLLRA